MKAIILAAGRGSRMGNLTADQPKCLTILHEKPLIMHQIDSLTAAGIEEIALVTGYKSEALANYGTRRFHNSRWAETNMVSSLLCAREWLDNEDCIVSYSDIFYHSKIIGDLILSGEEIAIAYDVHWLDLWVKRFVNPLDDAETFKLDKNNYVIDIGQKAVEIKAIQGQYMGLLKFKAGVFSRCLDAFPTDILERIDMTNFLNKLIQNFQRIKAIPNTKAWGEIDNQSDIKHYT